MTLRRALALVLFLCPGPNFCLTSAGNPGCVKWDHKYTKMFARVVDRVFFNGNAGNMIPNNVMGHQQIGKCIELCFTTFVGLLSNIYIRFNLLHKKCKSTQSCETLIH